MSSPTLVVLAAGIGSRYGGFKQIDPVGPAGEIVLDYSLYDAWKAGFGNVVFVIRDELEEPFREHFEPCLKGRMNVDYCHQRLDDLPGSFDLPASREKPWGTGHATYTVRNHVGEPFAVINADDFYGRDSYRKLSQFLTNTAESAATPPTYAMVAFQLAKTLSPHGTVARGICSIDSEGFLQTVEEHTKIQAEESGEINGRDTAGNWRKLQGTDIVSMNMWGLTPAIFPELETRFRRFLRTHIAEQRAEFYLPTVVDELIQEQLCDVHVLRTAEHWFGVTYREDKEAVTTAIQSLVSKGLYPSPLWNV
ncbi:MAG: nucleotidyltransferase [Candidatus Pacebacteria bacterium]|nr:nucleotidyltransferase [Candidatus Paceibacterota bacterium]